MRDMNALSSPQLLRVADIYGLGVQSSEDGDMAMPIEQLLVSLSMAMWERLPSAELIFQARNILSESELNPMMEQEKLEEAFEEFMESVIDEDNNMSDVGALSLHYSAASQARESVANPQNPDYLGHKILGRAAYVNPLLGESAGLILDMTSPPFKPGDLAYCACLDATAAAAVTLKRPQASGPTRALRGSFIKPHPPAEEGGYPKFSNVERYTGHALWQVTGPEVIAGKGALQSVPSYTSHDFSMHSHVAAFEGEDMVPSLMRAHDLVSQWRAERASMTRLSSGSGGMTKSPVQGVCVCVWMRAFVSNKIRWVFVCV